MRTAHRIKCKRNWFKEENRFQNKAKAPTIVKGDCWSQPELHNDHILKLIQSHSTHRCDFAGKELCATKRDI